jgi:hypothetical protein
MCKYKIIRFYKDQHPNKRVIARGLTLEQAQAHCQDPETSSSTCKKYVNRKRTERLGMWFDGYTEH